MNNDILTYEQFIDLWFEKHASLYNDLLKTIASKLSEYYNSVKNTHSSFCIFYFDGLENTYNTYKWVDGIDTVYTITNNESEVVFNISQLLVTINNNLQESFDQWKKDWLLYLSGKYSFETDETTDENKNRSEKNVDDIIIEVPEASKIETVKGILLNPDGSYVLKQSKTLNELMRMFIQWWELVLVLVRSSDNTGLTTTTKSIGSSYLSSNTSDANRASNIVCDLNALVMINSVFDKMGHLMREGLTCPVCGKKVHSLKIGGFCSTQCALTYVAKMACSFKLTPSEAYKEFMDTLDKITGLLDHTSLILNALTGIPDILRELATIPEPYKSYVLVKINEGFCELYACVLKLMIKKQELIKKMMKPIKLGFIKKPLKVIFTSVEVILNAMEYTQLAFDMTYMFVYLVISKLKVGVGGLTLSSESFGWMLTPHSFISPKPYTCPDTAKLICELPGGNGMLNIMSTKPLMPSGMQNINFLAIDTMITSLFPPLTPLDYYLEPELFLIRYLFSDLSNIVLLIRQQLEDLMTFGLDYIPKFENLLPVKPMTINGVSIPMPNLGYIWFVLGLLDAWAPHSSGLVGSLLNPAI